MEPTIDLRTGKGRSEAATTYALRIECVIDLASAIEHDQFNSPGDAHEDLLGSLADGWKASCDESMRPVFEALKNVDVEEAALEDEIAHELCRKDLLGYVVKFATPVYRYASEGSTVYSWGRYTTNWFYGETMEQAWERAIMWATRHKARALKQSAAANAD